MRRVSSRELGSYVLEVAGVLLGLAAFIVGTSDVVKIFQARSAVRAAVNEGTRCLYPTDAGCTARSPGGLSTLGRTFDVWVWGSGYQIPQESYLVNAQWNTEPVYEIPLVTEPVTGVQLERSQYQYTPREVLFPTTAHAPYFLQTSTLPIVTGGGAFSPSFVDPVTRREVLPQYSEKIGVVTKSTTSPTRVLIRSVDFPVNGAWPTMLQDSAAMALLPTAERSKVPCYYGATQAGIGGRVLDWNARQPEACRYRVRDPGATQLGSNGEVRVPLMIRVTGSTFGTASGGEGRVEISMSWKSPTASFSGKELGGRVFKGEGNGNFIPRGLAKVDISSHLHHLYSTYETELDLYNELPLVPIDAEVTLKFYLVSTNGTSVKWQGDDLEVFYPKFRFVHETFGCGHSPDPNTCAAPPQGVKAQYVALTPGGRFKAARAASDSCSLAVRDDVIKDEGAFLTELERGVQQGAPATPRKFLVPVATDPKICVPTRTVHQCSGGKDEYYEGCAPDVATQPTLEEVPGECDVPAEIAKTAVVRSVIKGTKTSRMERVLGCSDAALPQCALSNVKTVETAVWNGTEVCNVAQAITTPPKTDGPFFASTCTSRDESVRRQYRETYKVPGGVDISVIKLPTTPAFSESPPSDACVPYALGAGSSRELLCGTGLSPAAAERCCVKSEGRCRKQEVIQREDTARDGAKASILMAAQERVVAAVQAGYPAAYHQTECDDDDDNCLEVNTSFIEGDSKAVVSARVNVPLHILSPVVGAIEHSSSRLLEQAALQ